jgi:hypothetical protein
LNAVAKVQLLQDVSDVCLDGRLADVELVPDLGVGEEFDELSEREREVFRMMARGQVPSRASPPQCGEASVERL